MSVFKRKKVSNQTISDKWEQYFTTIEDHSVSIRFDTKVEEAFIANSLYNTYILSVYYDEQFPNGFPTKPSLELLYEIEDRIRRSWNVDNLYKVGVITTNGVRDFVFMSSKKIPWESLCKKLMKKYKGVMFMTTSFLEDYGNYYYENVSPDKYGIQWMRNRTICKNLEEQGETFQVPRKIDFYSFFESDEDAEKFVSKLTEESDFIDVETSITYDRKYEVYASTNEIPTFERMTEFTTLFINLCEVCNGIFDSWGTTIEKEQ